MADLSFTENEVETMKKFAQVLGTKVKFGDMSPMEVLQVSSQLMCFDGVLKKIEAHIFEVKRIIPGPAPEADKV